MKQAITLLALSCAMTVASCGNQAGAPTSDTAAQASDSVPATDTIAAPSEAGVPEAIPEAAPESAAAAIREGAPLAETLRKCQKVTFGYDELYGLYCDADGQTLLIEATADITDEGSAFVEKTMDAHANGDDTSDIAFNIGWIKPSAKVVIASDDL